MSSLFACPPKTTLTTIPDQNCPERFDQIIRFGLQRIQATPSFTATTIKTQATWTPLLTATDDTKMVLTPLIPGVTIPRGEIIKEGGNDNSTIGGIPRLGGRSFVANTAVLEDVEKAVRAALRELASDSAIQPGFTNIWMYMFNRFGQIIANGDGAGIHAYNIFVGDVGSDGLNKPNTAAMSWDFAGGWSDNVSIFEPTAPFNPINL